MCFWTRPVQLGDHPHVLARSLGCKELRLAVTSRHSSSPACQTPPQVANTYLMCSARISGHTDALNSALPVSQPQEVFIFSNDGWMLGIGEKTAHPKANFWGSSPSFTMLAACSSAVSGGFLRNAFTSHHHPLLVQTRGPRRAPIPFIADGPPVMNPRCQPRRAAPWR